MADEAQPKKGYGKGSSKRRFINVREIAYATERLGGLSIQDAAVAAGYKASYGPDLEAKPLIQKFIQDYNTRIQEELAKKEVPRLEKAAVSRTTIIERLWALANMAPCGVAENINAQVRACDALAEIQGMKIARTYDMTHELRGRSEEELDFFATHGYFMDTTGSGASGAESAGQAPSESKKIN